VYCIGLVFKWIQEQGGLVGIEAMNDRKAAHLYEAIDQSDGFYRGHAATEDRSRMNVTFRCRSEELEAAFLAQAAEHDMTNLKGHRSVGGLRASIYNAFPESGCRQLADFMRAFASREG
jgi:phosphoserine aminotransferase